MRNSRKRKKDPSRKIREIKVMADTRVYDMLSAMAGPDSLVGTFEELVEREFVRRARSMGLQIPPIHDNSC